MTCVLVYSLVGVFPLKFLSSPTKTARYAACYLLLSSLLLLVPDGIPHQSKGQLHNRLRCHPLAADSSSPHSPDSFSFPRDGACSEAGAAPTGPGEDETFSALISDNTVEIDPPILEFGRHPIGQHTDRTVKIINHSQKHSLHLVSVSGNSSDFHPTFFRSDRVAPGDHTLFDVYFLPREVGAVESTIKINTENGLTYPLPVSGQGTQNPYQLRSLSARIPLNATFSPVISLYNPHSSPLQVTEMYSTGLDLHLELLSPDASPAAWEVPPYQSKQVMRVHFSADRLEPYTAFIRVKTSFDKETEARLIIPLEVEVLAPDTLFSSAHELDFGLLCTSDAPKSLPLSLYNPSAAALRITSLALSSDAPFLRLDLGAPAPRMDAGSSLSVGSLQLSPGLVSAEVRVVTGSVSVNASAVETSQRPLIQFSIPYTARIEHGHLRIPKLIFHSDRLPMRPQTISVWLSHTFRQPLAVYGASLSYPHLGDDYLSFHEFRWPLILDQGEEVVALSLRFMASSPLIHAHAVLHVYSNTSDFELPVHIYNQQLQLAGEVEMEFAVINPNITKTLSIRIRNLNADTITVRDMVLPVLSLSLERVVMLPLLEQQLISTADTAVPFVIQPSHEATLTFKLARPSSGDVSSDVILITDHQRLRIPVHYRSISGSLEAQRIIFQPSFPGHVETKSIIVRNTFTQTVRLVDLRQMDPIDPRIYLLDQHDISHVELTAFSSTHIAKLAFDPMRGFPGKVFTGGFSEFLSVEWLSSLDAGAAAPEVDTRLYERMQAVWRECQTEELTKASASFELDTDVLSGIKVEVEASLHWPSITPDAPIHFPLTLVGNYSTQSVPVMNPSDDRLVVQALLLHFYPDVQAALDIVDDWLDIPSSPPAAPSSFYIADAPSGRVLDYAKRLHPTSYSSELGTSVSDLAWTYVLPPKSLVNITVVFEPHNEDKTYSVILMRNNLTVMDAVVLHGAGAEGKFSLDGKMPESQEALQFNMTVESLKICNTSTRLSHSVPFITRTLVARNQGQLAIHIESLSINGYPCQGFGFSIRQCRPFTLRPQSSLELDITFTPDFTLYSLERDLILYTRHGRSLTFHLFASVPAEFLPLCFANMPRPPWEPYIPFVVVPLLLFASGFTLYLILQPRKRKVVAPIPGVPSTYSREGKDKVFKFAAQFSFANGGAEDPMVVKDKLERCEALIERIKIMNKKNPPPEQTDGEVHLEGMVPAALLPGHRDLVEIMRSSYDPDNPSTTPDEFTNGHVHQDYSEMESMKKRSVAAKASSVETNKVEEKQLVIQSKSLMEIKHSSKSNSKSRRDQSPQSRNQGRSRQEDLLIPKEMKSSQETMVCKEMKYRAKSDLKVTIPSAISNNNESENKNDSPTNSPSAESKKLTFSSQPNRGSKSKKSKPTQKSKVKIRKEKSKTDKSASPKESNLDSESQEADILAIETSDTSVVDTQQQDGHHDQIENSAKLIEADEDSSFVCDSRTKSPQVSEEMLTGHLPTPPKEPLPLHRDAYPRTVHGKAKSGNQKLDRRVDLTNRKLSPVAREPPFNVQYSKASQIGGSDKDVINLLGERVLPHEEGVNAFTSPAPIVNKVRVTDPTVHSEAADMRTELNTTSVLSHVISKSDTTKSDHSVLPTSISYHQIIPETSCDSVTRKESDNSEEKIQDNDKRVPFSGMSEELKQKIEEVCAPLTFDDPPLTGETHELLSSILSTDAEPFVPDDKVLKRLLENAPMFQSERKQPQRKHRQQSGVLGPQALAQLSLLLQNQSQCLNVSQDDYVNLAASLQMDPRILHQHLQYCWLCYQCNLIGLLGQAPHGTPQASLNLHELLNQLQQTKNLQLTERTDNSFDRPAVGGLAQPSYHQGLLKDKQTTHSPDSFNSFDGTFQKSRIHFSNRIRTCNSPPTSKHHSKMHSKNSDWSKERSQLQREKSTYAPFGLQQKPTQTSISPWNDSKRMNEANMLQRGKPETSYENLQTKSHDDSSFFERSILYENLGPNSLSNSDPWSKDQFCNKWNSSEGKSETPLLTESELLPTELMNSRPPSPQAMGHPRTQAPKSRNSSNEKPLLFLGPTIWSSKDFITEEDRLNSWETITGKVKEDKKETKQSRNSSYNPFDEKRWTPLKGRGGDKSVV